MNQRIQKSSETSVLMDQLEQREPSHGLDLASAVSDSLDHDEFLGPSCLLYPA